MITWLCTKDGVVVGDMVQHSTYTGHRDCYVVVGGESVEEPPQPVEGDEMPEWYREQKAAELEQAANPPDWPPTPEKAQQP